MENLKKLDPEIFFSIKEELTRQRDKLEMIASENLSLIHISEPTRPY